MVQLVYSATCTRRIGSLGNLMSPQLRLLSDAEAGVQQKYSIELFQIANDFVVIFCQAMLT